MLLSVHDLAFALRLVRRAPGVTFISALVVALGVACTTTMFSVAYGVLLRPLPYPHPERLVAIWSRLPDSPARRGANVADAREWRRANTVFDDIALANSPQNFNLIGAGEPERVVAGRLASNLLPVLGVSPALGRGFSPTEEQSGADRVVLLGDGLWRRRFGADPSIIGRSINLSGTSYVVIGVMPPAFRFPEPDNQLWIPLTFDPRQLSREIAGYGAMAVGRLRPGVALASAQREMDVIAARLEAQYPATNRQLRVEVLPLPEAAVREIRPTLRVMLAAVSCLLLIACLNLAGVLGTRAESRSREFAVRLALGASRGRLVLQALAEVTPIVAIGGLAGIAVARLAIAIFIPLAPPTLPRVDRIEINGAVLAFSLGVLALTGLVGGVLPALQAWRTNAPGATSPTRSATASRDRTRLRDTIVIAELALTLPLLVGAAALTRSFSAVIAVEPGFQPAHLVTMHMAIPRTKYKSDAEIAALYTRLVDQVQAVPGIVSAAMVNRLPLSGNDMGISVQFDPSSTAAVPVQARSVTPGYFQTMGIALREGRVVAETDRANAPLVVVIDERLARAQFPGERAIGKRVQLTVPGERTPAIAEIVGVVANIRHAGLETDTDRQIYFSYHQFTDGRIVLVAKSRAGMDARTATAAVIVAVRAIDPEQPVYDVRTMEAVMDRATGGRWLSLAIVTTFALSSLLLASVGLYGVVSYVVSERVKEFGVRLALGARPSDVCRMVLRQGAMLAMIGAALGLGGAIALALSMRSLLFQVQPLDPVIFGAAGALLVCVSISASYVPARRASLTDPARALRSE
jgi:putative ABC transport system permease protein